MWSRRDFLAGGIGLGAASLLWQPQRSAPAATSPVFRHGVASGDPLSNRVVLWTRVTVPAAAESQPVDVEWMLARDGRMTRVVGRGSARTSAVRDFTVKVDAAGLEPGATYYYRFVARGERSPVGRTRTLPLRHVDRVRVALASCANHPFGYFNVYARLAARADLDAVIFLGDYIYEYANNSFAGRRQGDGRLLDRVPVPDRELVTLADYRARYAQYREDHDLQAAHRQHPFIAVWDDHESANNAWRGGAANHNPEQGEGDWETRVAAALRAWREWMPVREVSGAAFRMYRRFTFGDLADLFMLDTRVTGRDEQAARPDDLATITRTSRQLLGADQEEWLFGSMEDSTRAKRPWQILAQQVLFAPQTPAGGPVASVDSWDGYRAARDRVFAAAASADVTHLVVVTGDIHSSWAYDLAPDPFRKSGYDASTGRGAIGTELVTPAVTSPGWFGPEREREFLSSRPHLRFVEGQHRGYVVVDLTRDRLQADWWFVPTITERTAEERCARSLMTEASRPQLVEAAAPVLRGDAPAPAP